MKVFNILTGVYLLVFNVSFLVDMNHHRHQTDFNVSMLAFIFSIYLLSNVLERSNRDNKS